MDMFDLQAFLEGRTRPAVVAILNITPDSFFDGGKYTSTELVLKRAKQCMSEGADILELGAESTGPGSEDVSEDEEIARLLPALQEVCKAFPETPISIDTYKASIASAALSHGADIINDVTAGRGHAEMMNVVSKVGCGYIMMYSKDDSARTTKSDTKYDDVLQHIEDFLQERMELAITSGIKKEQLIVDPGLGHFVSSDPSYSFQILENLRRFTRLAPVLVSPSRKSFLAGPENLPPSERLPATLEASITAKNNGASLIRTHDVGDTVRVLED